MNESVLPELPGGWVWTNVGEICDLINGRAFKPEEWSTQGIPIIRIQNLNNSNTDFNYCNFEVEEKYIVNNGQLLFAWSGTPGTSFGAHIWNRGRAVLNQHIFKIGINENCINKIFFKYLINRNIDEYIGKAHGTAGLAHITKNKFENSIISIPPFPEQLRIVTKLEELFTRLDAGVSELKKTQAQLKRYRQSVLKAACEGKLVPTEAELAKAEGHAYEPTDVLLARIKEDYKNRKKVRKNIEIPLLKISDLTTIPEGWVQINFSMLIDKIKRGPSKKCNQEGKGIRYITSGNLQEGKVRLDFDYKFLEGFDGIDSCRLLSNDLILNCVNSLEQIGKSAIFESRHGEAIVGFNNYALELRTNFVSSQYANIFCQSEIAKKQIYFLIKRAVNQVSFATRELDFIAVPLPPLAEQRRIVLEVERRLSIADGVEKTVSQSLAQAQRLRQSILKKAFEGRLVAQDASDEPAGVLLERIKAEKARRGEKKRKK